MTLKEFVSMVEEIAMSVNGEGCPMEKTATTPFYRDRGGIQCSVCLNADGSLTTEQTSISVQFVIPGKG